MSYFGMAGMPGADASRAVNTIRQASTGVSSILDALTRLDNRVLPSVERRLANIAKTFKGLGLGGLSGAGGSYNVGRPVGATAMSGPGMDDFSKAKAATGGGTASSRMYATANAIPGLNGYGGGGNGGGGSPSVNLMPGPDSAPGKPGMFRRGAAALGRGLNNDFATWTLVQALPGAMQKSLSGAASEDLLYNQGAIYNGFNQGYARTRYNKDLTRAFGNSALSNDDLLQATSIGQRMGLNRNQMMGFAQGVGTVSRAFGTGDAAAAQMMGSLDSTQNALRLRAMGIFTRDPRNGNQVALPKILDQIYSRTFMATGGKATPDQVMATVRSGALDATAQSLGIDPVTLQNAMMAKARAGGADIGSAQFNKANPALAKSVMASIQNKERGKRNLHDETFQGLVEGMSTFNSAVGKFDSAVDKFVGFLHAGRGLGFAGGLGGSILGTSVGSYFGMKVLGRVASKVGEKGLFSAARTAGTRVAGAAAEVGGGAAAAWGAAAVSSAIAAKSLSNVWGLAGANGERHKVDRLTQILNDPHADPRVKAVIESHRAEIMAGLNQTQHRSAWDALTGKVHDGKLKAALQSLEQDAASQGLHFSHGGVVPGNHHRDDVPIYATPGEVVVPRSVVDLHGGADSLMRALGIPSRRGGSHFAAGGEVAGWGAPGTNLVTASAGGLHFSVNRREKTAFEGFVTALIRSGYKPKVIQGFNNRNIAGTNRKSNHAYGAAIDIDPALNPRYGSGGGKHRLPDSVAALAAKFGLDWGGAYHDSKDYMHFEAHDGPASASSSSSSRGGGLLSMIAQAAARLSGGVGFTRTGGTFSSLFFSGGAGSAGVSAGAALASPSGDAASNVSLAKTMAATKGWTGAQWDALYWLWNQESGFRTTAGRPGHAYGIPQANPGSKMASAGGDWLTNPETQITWGLNYIAKRYGSPSGAVAHKHATRGQMGNKEGWYAKGAWRTKDEEAHLHEGEMVLPAAIASSVRTALSKGSTIGGRAGSRGGSGCAGHPVSITIEAGRATLEEARRLAEMIRPYLEHDDLMVQARSH